MTIKDENFKKESIDIYKANNPIFKEIEFANLEKEVQEEWSKNGVSDKYIKLKNQLMALRKEIDDLRKKANLPKDEPLEQQNKLSNPFALELKLKPPTD